MAGYINAAMLHFVYSPIMLMTGELNGLRVQCSVKGTWCTVPINNDKKKSLANFLYYDNINILQFP